MDNGTDNKNGYNAWLKPERISSWVDGIFAFAMTLLVVTIDVPKVNSDELAKMLVSNLHNFETYIVSFLLLGVFWVHHQKLFRYIEKVSDGFIWLNILKMMFVVFIPFTTRLSGDYGHSVCSHVLFNLNLFIVSMFICLLLLSAYKNKLLDIKTFHINEFVISYSLVPITSLAALIISFYFPSNSSYIYLAIPLVKRLIRNPVMLLIK